jgi:hypothetical protein
MEESGITTPWGPGRPPLYSGPSPNEIGSGAARTIHRVREGYDVAQICLNGHVVTAMAGHVPERMRNFCEDCGAATITECPSCDQSIPGFYLNSAIIGSHYEPPAFCGDCGKPFPWTERRLEAGRELAFEAEHLSGEERQQLADSLNDLTRDTPKTQVAAGRFRRLAAKAGVETGNALRTVLVDVMSDAAKKALGF